MAPCSERVEPYICFTSEFLLIFNHGFNDMGRNKQKERASCQRPDQLFNSKKSKEDGDVEILENGSEEPDNTECLASEMSYSSAQSIGRKSTGIYTGSYSVSYSYIQLVARCDYQWVKEAKWEHQWEKTDFPILHYSAVTAPHPAPCPYLKVLVPVPLLPKKSPSPSRFYPVPLRSGLQRVTDVKSRLLIGKNTMQYTGPPHNTDIGLLSVK